MLTIRITQTTQSLYCMLMNRKYPGPGQFFWSHVTKSGFLHQKKKDRQHHSRPPSVSHWLTTALMLTLNYAIYCADSHTTHHAEDASHVHPVPLTKLTRIGELIIITEMSRNASQRQRQSRLAVASREWPRVH